MNTKPEITLINESGFSIPLNERDLGHIVKMVTESEKRELESLEVVYVDEEAIIELNKEYLNKDYVTDIITFHYHEDGRPLDGTLTCCAQRIAGQAEEFLTEPEEEFRRIIIHGLLHLMGYDDQTAPEKAAMTKLEDKYLNLIKS